MSEFKDEEEMNCIACSQVREMFSPWLDGEISSEESNFLTGHLQSCEACRQEFDLWKKISATLRENIFDCEPSPEFCAGVIKRLQEEKITEIKSGRRIPRGWKVPAAAAAAAMMIFAGSWGIMPSLKPSGPNTEVVLEQGQPDSTIGSGESLDSSTGQDGQVGPADNSNAANRSTANNTGNPTGLAAAVPSNTYKEVVLLGTQREIASTILKISVSHLENAKSSALSMTTKAGGNGQLLSTQKNGDKDLVILRITVPRDNGNTLITNLSGLGQVFNRLDEKKDITTSYNEAVNKLNEIQARISAGVTASEKSQLEAEASVLKRQIEAWDKETGYHVVILWLEH